MESDVSNLTLLEVSEPVPPYLQVVNAPPIDLQSSATVVELAALVERSAAHRAPTQRRRTLVVGGSACGRPVVARPARYLLQVAEVIVVPTPDGGRPGSVGRVPNCCASIAHRGYGL